MVISIIGPSGCGKGTQAEKLAAELGVPVISTGQLLRSEYSAKSAEGIEAHKYWSRGEWVPAGLIMKLLRKRVEKSDCSRGFILDGTPRKMSDMPPLEQLLENRGQKLDRVFHLDTSDETSLARIHHRILSQEERGQEVRADETLEAIKERLRVYHQTIAPVLTYLARRGLLERIDNEGTVEEVFGAIRRKA